MRQKKAARTRVPKILPREKLTKKAKRAILKYVEIKLEKCPIMYLGVEKTLEAERMRRSDLYAWLEAKGYRWKANYGFWKRDGE